MFSKHRGGERGGGVARVSLECVERVDLKDKTIPNVFRRIEDCTMEVSDHLITQTFCCLSHCLIQCRSAEITLPFNALF